MSEWTPALEGWLTSLRDEMRMSLGTLTKYRQVGRDYSLLLADVPPGSVTEAAVRSYVRSLSHLSPVTVRVHLSAIRSFHAWHSEATGCPDPTRRIHAPRCPERLPRGLTEREAAAIVRSAETVRDRAMVEVLYSTGCRAAELLGLDLPSVELDRGIVTVLGKGNRERVCLLTPSAVTSLGAWIRLRGPLAVPAVFVSRYGRRLSAMGLWNVLQAIGERAGLGRPLHAHMFRHAFATHLLRGGADLHSIQVLLGHRSLSSTQVYLSADDESLRSVHAKCHPLGHSSDLKLIGPGDRETMDGETNQNP